MTDWNRAELNRVMRDFGLRTSKSLGQHFLTGTGIVNEIAELSGADGGSGVVEIGPGLGILTAALAGRAAKVVALETDRRLMPALAHTLDGLSGIEILNADALKTDFPVLIAEKLPGLRPLLCANLPYNITTPLLTAILTPGCFERVTVMVQREVALRLTARAGTPAYGAFTLFVRNRTDARMVMEVPASAFLPPPKVDSAVVTLERTALRCPHPMFERVVRAAFAQRRKQLINALSAGLSISRGDAVRALEICGVDPRARGETLELETFARLAETLG